MSTPVEVTTVDLATGKCARRIIDHDDFEDRKWLGKHCFWAMRNGRSVETSPAASPSMKKVG